MKMQTLTELQAEAMFMQYGEVAAPLAEAITRAIAGTVNGHTKGAILIALAACIAGTLDRPIGDPTPAAMDAVMVEIVAQCCAQRHKLPAASAPPTASA